MFILVNGDGYVESYALVGTLVGGIEVSPPGDLDHFESHYGAYLLKDGSLSFNDDQESELEKGAQLDEIRTRRETECFPVINRGQLWYEGLTEEQKTELKAWYQAWLDATDTLAIPEKPGWLS